MVNKRAGFIGDHLGHVEIVLTTQIDLLHLPLTIIAASTSEQYRKTVEDYSRTTVNRICNDPEIVEKCTFYRNRIIRTHQHNQNSKRGRKELKFQTHL